MAYSIGLILDRISGSFEHRVFQGAYDYIHQARGHLRVFAGKRVGSPISSDLGQDIIYDIAGSTNIDALIMVTGSISSFMTRKEMFEFFLRYKDIPVVSLSIPLPGFPSILIDNSQGIRMIMEHLIDVHGYSRIAFVSGPVNNNEAEVRLKTYRQMLVEYGIPYDPTLVEYGDFTLQSGISAAENLLEKKGAPIDAIVASNDEMGLGVVMELKKRGVKIPEDIAVTGFDDIDDVRYALPPFTTIKQPLYEMGQKGAECVYNMLNGIPVEGELYLKTELVVRQSCGCISYSPLHSNLKDSNLSIKSEKKECPGAILERVLEQARTLISGLTEEMEKEIILFDRVFFTGLETSDDTVVLKFLKQRLFSELTDEQSIEVWRQILMIFRHEIVNTFEDDSRLVVAERILNNIWRLICDSYRFVYGKNTMFHIKELHILKDIVLTLPLSLDMDILMERIKSEVPKVGINTIFISFFEGDNFPFHRSGVPTDFSRLVLAVIDGNPLDLKNVEIRYPTRSLLPPVLLKKLGSDAMIFLPLNYKENYYGFVAFSLQWTRSLFHESLRDQISVTLDSTRLFQEMHHMSDEIMRQNLELKRLYQFKSDFFSKVSHELRTPMNTINGNIDLLQYGSYDTSEEVLDALNKARSILELGEWKFADKSDSERFFKDLKNMAAHIKKDSNLKTYSMGQLLESMDSLEGPRTSELGEVLSTIYDLIKKEEADTLGAYKKIKQASAAMIGLIDMILNLSSVESQIQIVNGEVNVAEFARQQMEKGREYALETGKKDDLDFSVHIDENVPEKVIMDEKWTGRVLSSYINNAVDFSQKGAVKLTVSIQDKRVYFKVSDQGQGIKEKDKAKIFTEFGRSSTGEKSSGTGLTLALSRRLIEMQGGRVGFESEYGMGSCFWFSLPLTEGVA